MLLPARAARRVVTAERMREGVVVRIMRAEPASHSEQEP